MENKIIENKLQNKRKQISKKMIMDTFKLLNLETEEKRQVYVFESKTDQKDLDCSSIISDSSEELDFYGEDNAKLE